MPHKPLSYGDLAKSETTIDAIEAETGIALPTPTGVDEGAKPALWPVDIAAWNKASKLNCTPH